jgi:CHC2 zinc finger/Toprim domain
MRSGLPVEFNPFTFAVENDTLYMTLPSGRRLAYPQAQLRPGKFEGTRVINCERGASEDDIWRGLLVENAVQSISRDLLAGAMLRLDAAGFRIVLHCHDEAVCEVPEDFDTMEFLQLMTELPDWAKGLPIAAKAWTGPQYSKTSKVQPETPSTQPALSVLRAPEVSSEPEKRTSEAPNGSSHEHNPEEDGYPPLADLINEPVVDDKIVCPFHSEKTPSLHIYADHFHCFGCGAHGDRVDWLMMVEGLSRDEAIRKLETQDAPIVARPTRKIVDHTPGALAIFSAAKPITGTLAERYLHEHRKIDLAALPSNIDDILRFHPHCPFKCLIALMRNPVTDEPTGIQRIALTAGGSKIERKMLGRSGVVQLWPTGARLVVGEGLETTLAAALHLIHRDEPLRPAWAALSSDGLARFPLITGVEQLIILVDNDLNGVGQEKANQCAVRWQRAGRRVQKLMPKQPGWDFNDVLKEGR